MTHKKQIVLDFYSCHNLGDDLFVEAFAEHFSDCEIHLLVNPKCVPKKLPKNVRILHFSHVDLRLRRISNLASHRGHKRMVHMVEHVRQRRLEHIAKGCDAFVKIGGSIFMQHAPGCPEIDFSTEEKPDFSLRPLQGGRGNRFIIGANLGPVYSEDYWEQMEAEFRNYRHVCLRDYASYCKMRTAPNVQYAPDVLFLIPRPYVGETGENVAISVMDIRQNTQDEAVAQAYYDLLERAIAYFLGRDIPVTLMSFCQWQGDERAVQTLLDRFPGEKRLSACYYRGSARRSLKVLSGASFVVGTRFHSTILGISFGKPVFPIVYNSKTAHYLADLSFPGKSAALEELPSVTLEDLLYNYQHHIIADCADHQRFAGNQFRGLESYLEEKENAIESDTV